MRECIISWLALLSLGVKTTVRCSVNRSAFSLLLLAQALGIGVSLQIGVFGCSGFMAALVGHHMKLSYSFRLRTQSLSGVSSASLAWL